MDDSAASGADALDAKGKAMIDLYSGGRKADTPVNR